MVSKMQKFSKIYNQNQKTIRNLLTAFHEKWTWKEKIVESIMYGDFDQSEKDLHVLFDDLLELSEYYKKQDKRIQKIFKQKTEKKYGRVMKIPFTILFNDLHSLKLSIIKRKSFISNL